MRSGLEETEGLNMTPIVDVVFNLLIFFLLGSTYLHEEQELELRLPKVSSAAPLTEAPEEITINVLPDGRIDVAGQQLSLDLLRDRLRRAREQYPDQVVLIRGDGEVRYERVAQVVAACREANITKLDLLVQEE